MLNGESWFYLCWINVQSPDIQLANLYETESDCDVYLDPPVVPKQKVVL